MLGCIPAGAGVGVLVVGPCPLNLVVSVVNNITHCEHISVHATDWPAKLQYTKLTHNMSPPDTYTIYEDDKMNYFCSSNGASYSSPHKDSQTYNITYLCYLL